MEPFKDREGGKFTLFLLFWPFWRYRTSESIRLRHFAQIWEIHIAKVAHLRPSEVVKTCAHRCENVSKLTPLTLFLRGSQLSVHYGGGQICSLPSIYKICVSTDQFLFSNCTYRRNPFKNNFSQPSISTIVDFTGVSSFGRLLQFPDFRNFHQVIWRVVGHKWLYEVNKLLLRL